MKNQIEEITGYIQTGLALNNNDLALQLEKALKANHIPSIGQITLNALQAGLIADLKPHIDEYNDLKVLAANAPMRRNANAFDEDASRVNNRLYEKTSGARLFGLAHLIEQEMKDGARN